MIDTAQLFPHKTTNELDARVVELSVGLPSGKRISAKARPAVSVHPNEYELHADEDLNGWLDAQASIRVFVQHDAISALLPEGADLTTDTAMVISVFCEATKVRRRVFLTLDPDRVGEWYGQIDLQSSDLSDVVELRPLLARTRRLPEEAFDESGAPLATYRGAILGVGDSVRLRVDPPKERHGSFRVRWELFSSSEHPWRKAHATEMFYIDTSDETPEVVLNGSHDLLKQTLMKKRPRGLEASVKAAVIAYIAHTTWTSLFLASLAVCGGEDGDEHVSWPTDDVKTKVLKLLLPLMVPERTDELERLQHAVELWHDSSLFSSLLTRLHSAIQSLMRVDDFVVKTLESTTDEEA